MEKSYFCWIDTITDEYFQKFIKARFYNEAERDTDFLNWSQGRIIKRKRSGIKK